MNTARFDSRENAVKQIFGFNRDGFVRAEFRARRDLRGHRQLAEQVQNHLLIRWKAP
jgi:hypothetical protein